MVLVSSIFIAAVPNFSKIAYEAGASVPFVLVCRFFVTVILLAILLVAGRHRILTSTRVLRLCLIGGVATAAMSLGILTAITLIDLSLVILILYLHPILIAWIGHVRGTYVISRFRFACCCFILLGLALALSISFGRLNIAGLAFAFLGACGAAGLVVANGDAVGEGGTLIVNFYTSMIALLLVSIAGPMIEPMTLPATGIGWLGLLGTGTAFCLGLALFLATIPHIGMVRATLITVIEPVFAIFLAMALFGERLAVLQWVGVAIVVAGLLLLEAPIKNVKSLLLAMNIRHTR
ncbi:EamA family transporter [Taklimakanibacter deserti]|uniref:EamA family transporter n=1 Tax=Taklimakanibacter deserti TaxID=2267839 RepID=UPI000E65033C